MANEQEIARLFDEIAERFPKFEGNPRMWEKYFADFPYSVLERALDEYTCEARYAPAISDIRKIAFRLRGGNRPQSEQPESPEERQERIQRKRDAGLVPVFDGGAGPRWMKEEHCIYHDGRWKLRIDYCMDVLGAAKVNQLIRQELQLHVTRQLGEPKNFPVEKYKQLLADMVALAQSDEEQGRMRA